MESFDEVVGRDGIDAITTPRTLPEYDDHTGGELHPPDENGVQDLSLGEANKGSKWHPNHEAFGPPSSVEVRCPSSTMDRLPSRDSVDRKLVKGDRVSVDATVFDGEEPGSYSNFHPGRHYGVLTSFKSKLVARVKWDEHYEGGSTTDLVPVVELKLEKVSTLPAKAVPYQLPCSTSSRNPIAPSMETSVDDDIESAGYVGEYFTDAALGECVISGFGTEGGEHILYYSPSQGGDVEWDSLSHVRQRVLDDLESTVDSTRRARRRAYYGRTRGLHGFPHNEVPTVTALMSQAVSRGLATDVPWQQRPMSSNLIRRVLRSTSSIFKYGCRIPKHDGEAERSPEAVRWKAGRDVEWLRLNEITTFDGSWTWDRIKAEHPDYKKSDIGTAFYIYDLKHSGEHRVRLVFNGSRQSPDTYTTTFAPTVRAESIRLFHMLSVEYSHEIRQYDVPQAFLTSAVDCTIFLHPPKGNADFPGQILLLKRMLYGAKQAAFLFYDALSKFFMDLGFVASDLDKCFFKRLEEDGSLSLMILHVDDFRLGATTKIQDELYKLLFDKWQVTTCSGLRFLGMDVYYDRDAGYLKLSMETYIRETITRFADVDTSLGYPFRELTGCLMWISCCVFGTVLMRVKSLARNCNNFGAEEYAEALKVLHTLDPTVGIIFRRGAAYCERVPELTRVTGEVEGSSEVINEASNDTTDSIEPPFYVGENEVVNEFGMKDVYRDGDENDRPACEDRMTTRQFRMVAYTDASFAVNDLKQSVSGWVIYLNGSPILFGSCRQTVVVDSSCSAEYVAASMCVKKMMELENMLAFLGIHCERPYKLYTDSTACQHIAENPTRMGKVRHLAIRTHLVRCHISLGDVEMEWCTTESMVADVMTKIVSSAQDGRLASRFYNDVDEEKLKGKTVVAMSAQVMTSTDECASSLSMAIDKAWTIRQMKKGPGPCPVDDARWHNLTYLSL
jgi:hypothetical protein